MNPEQEKVRRRAFRRRHGEPRISRKKEILQYAIVIVVIAAIVIVAYMVT
jgi:t-SNARE complex subunit (syntaxin)